MADFHNSDFSGGKGVRGDWRLNLRVSRVKEAANARLQHHYARGDWWKEQQRQAEQDLRLNGAELREQPVTGGARLQMVLDPTRTQRVEECRGKVASHDQRAAEYSAYVRALELLMEDGDGTVEVGVGDIQFFGL